MQWHHLLRIYHGEEKKTRYQDVSWVFGWSSRMMILCFTEILGSVWSMLCLICFLDIQVKKDTGLETHKWDSSKWEIKSYGAGGLPWWRSGWESACQCRGHGFEPWSGKIPHAAEQLGPWATTIEPACLEAVLRNKRGRDSERPAHCDEEWPPLPATRESPRTETKTQHSQK